MRGAYEMGFIAKPAIGVPRNTYRLRWRIMSRGGFTLALSSWTPETRYPSVDRTFAELADRIGSVCIEATPFDGGDTLLAFRIDGKLFRKLTYKGGMLASIGRTFVVGIEVEDTDGSRYLVQRDGTIHIE